MVFARAPRLGAVKRRLARDIGQRAALRFHVATMTRLLRALRADRRFRTVLAVTPDRARFRLPLGVARHIPQGTRLRDGGTTTIQTERGEIHASRRMFAEHWDSFNGERLTPRASD